jgi:hypothetical protein
MFRLPKDTEKPSQPTGGMGGTQHIDRQGPLGGVSPRPAPRELLSGSNPPQPTADMGGTQHITRQPMGSTQSPYAAQNGATPPLPPMSLMPPTPIGQTALEGGGKSKLAGTITPKNIGIGVILAGIGWLGFKYARNRDFDDLLAEEHLED